MNPSMEASVLKRLATLGLLALPIFATPVLASPQADPLGTCLVDSLDGKERKRLARWVFFSIAAHPEIKPYLSASQQDIDSNDQWVGKLVTRLLVEDCPGELEAASKKDPRAIEGAFELVGEVAMHEIMRNQQVTDAIGKYGLYTDQDKISAIVGGP